MNFPSHKSPAGETNLATLLKTMKPEVNEGSYVFCTVGHGVAIDASQIICSFKEKEAVTIILEKSIADSLHLSYSFVAAWITLTVHSSLEASGLTAAFSKSLADEGISCNVIAAYYHDHIFVDRKDAARAMEALQALSAQYN
jgi:hypothetical protein